MSKDELKEKITDLEQYIFKLKSDHEQQKWEQNSNDLEFLKEIQTHLYKWRDDRDVASMEYAFQMVEDWIRELETTI